MKKYGLSRNQNKFAMFYLWKDKRSTEGKMIVYITDYKEIKPDGKVYVDDVGLVEAEFAFY